MIARSLTVMARVVAVCAARDVAVAVLLLASLTLLPIVTNSQMPPKITRGIMTCAQSHAVHSEMGFRLRLDDQSDELLQLSCEEELLDQLLPLLDDELLLEKSLSECLSGIVTPRRPRLVRPS